MASQEDVDLLASLLAEIAPKKAKKPKEVRPEPTKEDHERERAKGISTTSYQSSLLEKKSAVKDLLKQVKQDLDLKEFGKHKILRVVPNREAGETWSQPPPVKCPDCGKIKGTC